MGKLALFKSRKDKNQMLLVEDAENEVLYYDKRIPSRLTSQSQQTKLIGIFDPSSNEVQLLPVSRAFNMKSEQINKSAINHHNDDEPEWQEKHRQLVETS